MKIILICLAVLFVIIWAVPGQGAIQKVPKQNKQDSTRTEVTPKTDDQQDSHNQTPAKDVPRLDSAPPPPKDSFIDKDGDGINDNLNRRKPPEIKKHRHPREREAQPQKAPDRKESNKPEASKKQSKR